MTEHSTSPWTGVGDQLGSLGLKLKYHAEQVASEDRALLDTALGSIGKAIEDVFDAVWGAVKDPAIRDDVKSVATGVADAVSSSLRGMAHELSPSSKSK
jgi:hypothetical protein